MSANPHANGGLLRKPLRLPDFRDYAVKVDKPGNTTAENTRPLGCFLRDIMQQNMTNFRVFGPDETASNKLDAVYEASKKLWLADYLPEDADGGELAPDGRVLEMLSEHTLEGWLEGYLLSGRHGFFSTYEAFAHVIDSMFNQHAKWLTICRDVSWRAPVSSLNLLITSTVWRQDHNGFTHQDPGFIDVVMNKSPDVCRVYMPPDANCLLSVANHCLKSTQLHQRHRFRQAEAPAVHDDGAGDRALHQGPGDLAAGEQRSGIRAGCRDGLRRGHPDPGGPGGGGDAAGELPESQDPLHQRRGPVQADAVHRAPARAHRSRLRQPVHH